MRRWLAGVDEIVRLRKLTASELLQPTAEIQASGSALADRIDDRSRFMSGSICANAAMTVKSIDPVGLRI
ncbi:hypothetical protein [Amnibacterium kyonggiense]